MATFSVTDRGTFRRCRRRWDYSSNARQGLTGIGSAPEPLELGGLVHRALADWIVLWNSGEKTNETYKVKILDKIREMTVLGSLFLKHAGDREEEITLNFELEHGHRIPSEHLESLHNVVDLGLDMMNNYQLYHKSPLPPHMRFAMPEQEVMIPVKGTEHPCPACHPIYPYTGGGIYPYTGGGVELGRIQSTEECMECGGQGVLYHNLSATLDGLVQDDKDRFLVLEHKTYDNRPRPMDLYMNDQFTGYAWVVRALGMGKVAGIAYDGMWKRAQPPKYMQKERRAGKMEDLFIRKIIEKGDPELDEWGRNLALEINEMANNPEIYPNVPWQGCSDCNFQDVCRMQLMGEDPTNLIKLRYTKRDVVRGGKV